VVHLSPEVCCSGQGHGKEQQTPKAKDLTIMSSKSRSDGHHMHTEKLYIVSAASPLHLGQVICVVQAQLACRKRVGDKNPPTFRSGILPNRAGRSPDQEYAYRFGRQHEGWLATESTLVDLGNIVLVSLSWTENLRMMG